MGGIANLANEISGNAGEALQDRHSGGDPISVSSSAPVAAGDGVIPVSAVRSALEVGRRPLNHASQSVDSPGPFAGGALPFRDRRGSRNRTWRPAGHGGAFYLWWR